MGIFSWLFQDLTNIRIASQEARNGEVTSLIDKIFETYLKTQDRNYFIDTLVNSNEINVFFEKDKTSDSTKPETPIGRNPSQRSNINFENKALLRSFIGTIFDDLNTQDLESHAKRIFSDTIKNRGHVPKDKEKIPAFIELFRIFFPEELTDAEKEVQINKKNESIIQSYRFLVMLRRAANEREEPKNLPEVLKKINPYCDPSEEKIQKVIEEYKKYKESDSDEKDLPKKQECKTALKQAIDDALKTCIPPQKAYHMQMSDEDKDDYLHRRIVNEAFDANQTSSPQNYELLQRLQKVTTDEFNGIVSFLDRMPKAELNASLDLHQPSIPENVVSITDELDPQLQPIPAEDAKRDKVAEFEKFLKKIDPDFQIKKDNYDEILSQYYKYKECEEEFKTRKSDTLNLDPISELTESEEEFKTRKTNTPNLDLIYELTESEKNLKDTISSCLQLSSVNVPTSPIKAFNKSGEAKKNSNRTTSTTYKINDKDFYEVLKYLEYEQIKAYYEQNPPKTNKYDDPKPNDTLGDLVKSIGEIPSNILRVFNSIRTFESSPREKDPSSTRE